MINNVYQLVAPKTIAVKFEDVQTEGKILVRPRCMALCHADQRYYQGKRDPEVMKKKLPMALIHECMGEVLEDPTGTYKPGDPVVMIPNVPGKGPDYIYENYAKGSGFLSSGRDGFMRELVNLDPDRVVSCAGVPEHIAAITEFVSHRIKTTECMCGNAHKFRRFDAVAHATRNRIAIIGDGSMGYCVACMLSIMAPESDLIVIGRNADKLSMFSFVKERYLTNEVPDDLTFDHAFECCGGEGSGPAIDMVIAHIAPQGTLMLLGVSENPVPVYTRNVLEKGMTLVGCSRSGRGDFEVAVEAMRHPDMQNRLSQIIHVAGEVHNVKDIKKVFATDMLTPFKTVFEWCV